MIRLLALAALLAAPAAALDWTLDPVAQAPVPAPPRRLYAVAKGADDLPYGWPLYKQGRTGVRLVNRENNWTHGVMAMLEFCTDAYDSDMDPGPHCRILPFEFGSNVVVRDRQVWWDGELAAGPAADLNSGDFAWKAGSPSFALEYDIKPDGKVRVWLVRNP